jgi:class 3 adenylate cyclase
MSREASVTLRRRIAAPPELVWALVADTNRFDRASGLTPGRYEFKLLEEGNERSRARVAQAKQLGFDIRWIEPPYDWVEGRFVSGERTFLSGPVQRGGFRVNLTPDGDGTMLEATAYVIGEGVVFGAVALVMKGKFRKSLTRYVDAIEAVLTHTHAQLGYDWNTEPPAVAARRALMTERVDEVTSGKKTPNSAEDFEFRARRFAQAQVKDSIRTKLLELLSTRPDEELTQIRPYEVARAWGEDKREVLRAFLYAARSGLVELQWQLNCPTCRVGAEVADSLGAIGKQAHCESCNISYDLDFAEHVEAAFKVSPSVRKVETAIYCVSSPWFRPHVFGQVSVEPGKARSFSCALPTGALLVRRLTGAGRASMEAESPIAKLRIVLAKNDEIHIEQLGRGKLGVDTEVEVVNETDHREVVLIERSGWSADVVLGSAIASLPDFLDLFATEAPAAGVELTVGALTLLFSDLTGSTALYERVGDARAFAIVEDHFRQMGRAIGHHGGAIVKTMGDAVMATFTSPADAVRAALDMVAECEKAHGDLGLSVKLGVHEGPCLAVRANDKLDYFGTTVNVAARLQALASGSELVIGKELMQHREVARLLGRLPQRPFTSALKGIKELQQLVAIDLTSSPRSAQVTSTKDANAKAG